MLPEDEAPPEDDVPAEDDEPPMLPEEEELMTMDPPWSLPLESPQATIAPTPTTHIHAIRLLMSSCLSVRDFSLSGGS